MHDSILLSIKKLLGIQEGYKFFDADIIMHINTVFVTLVQLGIGPPNGFTIEDDFTSWYDYIGENKNYNLIKTYMYLKVRTLFDPPTSSVLMEIVNKNISELEWRITIESEPIK